MAKRAKIGDVIQILTSGGVAYGQFTHKHGRFGPLLSVFDGFYAKAPDNFSQVVAERPNFNTFFPLQPALNEGLLSVVANVPVAASNSEFPKFRTRVVTPDGQCGPWWIWDGENEEMLERELTPSEMRYSLRGIISAPLLLERIEQGYRPEIHDV
ncbi:hypothetical protein [Roseovarius sp.]|uniref:hypothetical protein n=1 Tax=Roseovarius sp. TaxID=1486281 RepID=UPI000C6A7AAB|nr:hypothetical protein [Roseovarius sp.]MAZ20245.1 hypothetical protein [Roseovarius sp.]|tara:strand:+ start:2809 stop:3273 length:465 start_codon:yes stop_codon:yes gene_type:complete